MATCSFRSLMLAVLLTLSPRLAGQLHAQRPATVRVSATVTAPELSLGFQPDTTRVAPRPGSQRFRVGRGVLDVQSGAGSRVRLAPADSAAVRVIVDYLGS